MDSVYQELPQPVPAKCCTKCAEVQPLDAFGPDKKASDGRASHCRACRRAANLADYYRNKEARRRKHDDWRAVNRDRLVEQHRAWTAANPEHRAEYRRNYRAANLEAERAITTNPLRCGGSAGLVTRGCTPEMTTGRR